MISKRLIVQALVAALLFWGFKLILEQSLDTETLVREGKIAAIFGLVYAVYLGIRERFRKKGGPSGDS